MKAAHAVPLAILLALAIVVSAVAAVDARHKARQHFIELQALSRDRDELNIEWSQLQIERSTWAAHARVEQLAREKLSMRVPARADIEVVSP
ncbi:cell division protein FtsL [Wenzhouxiangella sp. XN24]|uniref:cell division protein FtsL n=1 Tax=Wenzhouxiangella sp. XN24 TaxID=2713569 RepID=UPI0013EBD05B|nr:cell division protein FtsL [Wenzhouxiangella sp. XN24]NGX15216.1 cell division protein FtsL [Wenzhouxiangella sp. XN24]